LGAAVFHSVGDSGVAVFHVWDMPKHYSLERGSIEGWFAWLELGHLAREAANVEAICKESCAHGVTHGQGNLDQADCIGAVVRLDKVLDEDEFARSAKSSTDVIKIGYRGPNSMNHQFIPRAIGDNPEVCNGTMRHKCLLEVFNNHIFNCLLEGM
jgi:hypothetical protein